MLGSRIKELRKQHRISQKELASVIQVSQQTIGGWETGRTEPGIEFIQKLANYFDVTTDYLLGKNQTPKWANDKDSHDLAKFLSDNEGSMNFNGEELTEEQAQQVRVAMTTIFWKNHKHD